MTPSLLLTASGYKEGKLYSLVPTNGNGDFTATRATTATRVDSAGLVDLVPYNLVQYSEMFADAAWVKSNVTLSANTTTAPDGTLTADTLTANASNSFMYQNFAANASSTYTFSAYVKSVSVGTTLNLVLSNAFGASSFAVVSFTTTGDWQRITVTGTSPTTQTAWAAFGTGGTFSTGETLYIWGAQLVEGTSARDYLRTETRLNIPRIDYSLGGCPNILLEPQRTNLCTYSEELNNSTFWLRTSGVGVNANTSISPSGTLTADTITGATGTGGWATPNVFQRSIPSLSSSTTYTFSVYIKGSGSVTLQLRDQTTGNLTSLVCNLTSSWQRFELSRTTGASTTGLGIIFGSATGNFDAWGAQLEQGAYATSYIPTTTASVTRNADSITRNNIFTNGLITASGGTWFVELRNNRVYTRDSSANGLSLNSVSGGNFQIRAGAASARILILKTDLGVNSIIYTTLTDTVKIAIKWNGSTADVFVNGVKVVSATAFNTTLLQELAATGGDVPKYINEMALFPTPLTDAQMSMLTSGIYPTAAAAYASLGLVSESPSCLTSTTTF